jgi:hypothetical protein
VTAEAISALERGERQRPYPQTVRALADALNLSDADRSALIASVPNRVRPQRSDEARYQTMDRGDRPSAALPAQKASSAASRPIGSDLIEGGWRARRDSNPRPADPKSDARGGRLAPPFRAQPICPNGPDCGGIPVSIELTFPISPMPSLMRNESDARVQEQDQRLALTIVVAVGIVVEREGSRQAPCARPAEGDSAHTWTSLKRIPRPPSGPYSVDSTAGMGRGVKRRLPLRRGRPNFGHVVARQGSRTCPRASIDKGSLNSCYGGKVRSGALCPAHSSHHAFRDDQAIRAAGKREDAVIIDVLE